MEDHERKGLGFVGGELRAGRRQGVLRRGGRGGVRHRSVVAQAVRVVPCLLSSSAPRHAGSKRELYNAAMAIGSDEQLLDEFFQIVTPTIEDMVTRAIQQGQRVKGLAVVVERNFDGEVAGGCCSRSEIGGRLRGISGVDDVARQRIQRVVKDAPLDVVPAVLLVHGEGVISVGIRRLTGKVAWLS